MKENTVNTDPDLIQTKKELLTRRHMRRDLSSTSWGNRVLVSVAEKQSVLKRAVRAVQRVPEVRSARIEELRKQIEAGTYKVDSTTLARKMLAIDENTSADGDDRAGPPVGEG